ncbi:MAG TPA: hypothetical protein VE869_00325 [Gemmatimonas sp.]|nr:hypothetical protein [Gemmatimonas sp.]
MIVSFERCADGDCIMRCTRDDGSTEWQRHTGARAVFFAHHDLTHLGVERTLGLRHGFFGLLAAGWSIAETEGKSGRGPLPAGSVLVEQLVALFGQERATGVEWTPEEFDEAMRSYAMQHGHAEPVALRAQQIAAVREAIGALYSAWRDTLPGSVLTLTFH